jgi:hypothetical protein
VRAAAPFSVQAQNTVRATRELEGSRFALTSCTDRVFSEKHS